MLSRRMRWAWTFACSSRTINGHFGNWLDNFRAEKIELLMDQTERIGRGGTGALTIRKSSGLSCESRCSSAARQALRNCIHAKNAQEPEAVSFLYNLLSFKGCNSRGPDSQFRVRGGTQALPLRLQRRLGAVKLRHEVTGVRSAQDGVMLSIRGRKPLRARAAILTGPPPAILKMEFDPPLKGLDAQWLQRMPMGTSLKLAAVYEQGPCCPCLCNAWTTRPTRSRSA
eukprot:g28680.t1